MADKLNIALLGCGRIAKRHADLISRGEIKNLKLKAVCDIEPHRASDFGKSYGVKSYSNVETMLESEQIDVLSVLTPSGLHCEHVLQAAEHVKNIIVEKPMALRLQDADMMIQKCDQLGVRLFVIKQNRFNLPIVKLKEAILKGRLGKIFLGTTRVRWSRDQDYYDQDSWRGTWRYDGGVLTNQASHHIDLLCWMLGDVESVFARTSTDLVDIEAETTGVVSLKFSSGALGIIEATTATRPNNLEGSLSVLGEHGSVVIGGYAVNKIDVWDFVNSSLKDESDIKKYNTNPPDVYGFGHIAYYNHVINCIKNEGPNLVDGLEGRKSLELISAIYESVEIGKEVYLKFKPKSCRLGE
jgi:predicted dehydrogenase